MIPKTYPLKPSLAARPERNQWVRPERSRKGFTLIELLVTIAIMGVVLVIIGGLASYTSGRLKSNQLKALNDGLRQSLSVIGQKMHNANDYYKIGTQDVYGFYVYNSKQNIVIISSDSGNGKTCTFFGLTDNRVVMSQAICSSSTLVNNIATDHPVTPAKIYVESLSFDAKNVMGNTGQTEIPQVQVIIKAHDKTDPNLTSVTLQTTFTMDGENVKYLNKL